MRKVAIACWIGIWLTASALQAQSLIVRGSVSLATRNAVDVVGNFAYTVGQNSFAIINISNPQSPSLTGQTTPGVAVLASVDVSNGYAYCAGMANGLVVMDVGNTSSPSWVTNRTVQGLAQHVAVYDTLVAVATNSNVSLFGIANPEDPHFLTSYGRASTWIEFDGAHNELHCGSASGAFLLELHRNGNNFSFSLLDQFGGDQNSPVRLQGDIVYFAHLPELRAVETSSYTISGQYNAPSTIRSVITIPGNIFIGLQSGLVQLLNETGGNPAFVQGVTLPAQVNGLAVNTSTHVVAVAHNSGLTMLSYTALAADDNPHPELPSSIALSAYPNPFNSVAHLKLSVHTPGTYSLSVFDLLGRTSFETTLNIISESEFAVPFENLSGGLYFARLSGGTSFATARLLYLP